MSKKTRNNVIIILIIVSVIALGYIWISFAQKPNEQEAQQLTQKTATNEITLDGSVVAERSADLGFVLPARITSITKKVGDVVKAGDVIAVQDNADVQAQVGVAAANVSSAQSSFEEAKNSLKKEKLKIHGLDGNDRKIQKAQIASMENGVDIQENAVMAAQESLKNAQAQLAKTVLRAPFDGIITRQDAEMGEVSGASVPPFITLASNDNQMKIQAYVSELDAARISVGQHARATFDSTGNEQFDAEVIAVDPAAQSDKGTYKVTLSISQGEGALRLGMHVSIILQ